MKRRILSLCSAVLMAAFFLPACARSFEPPVSSVRSELDVERVLNTQVTAWNRGDLVSFMAAYWNSPQLTFVSGSTRIQGWEATLARYRRRYAAPGQEMGQLAFSEIEIDVLAADAAFARGRFLLEESDGTTSSGRFSLLFRKLNQEWKIVYDHTSQ